MHCRATETKSLDHDVRVEYDGFWAIYQPIEAKLVLPKRGIS